MGDTQPVEPLPEWVGNLTVGNIWDREVICFSLSCWRLLYHILLCFLSFVCLQYFYHFSFTYTNKFTLEYNAFLAQVVTKERHSRVPVCSDWITQPFQLQRGQLKKMFQELILDGASWNCTGWGYYLGTTFGLRSLRQLWHTSFLNLCISNSCLEFSVRLYLHNALLIRELHSNMMTCGVKAITSCDRSKPRPTKMTNVTTPMRIHHCEITSDMESWLGKKYSNFDLHSATFSTCISAQLLLSRWERVEQNGEEHSN